MMSWFVVLSVVPGGTLPAEGITNHSLFGIRSINLSLLSATVATKKRKSYVIIHWLGSDSIDSVASKFVEVSQLQLQCVRLLFQNMEVHINGR